MKRQSKELVNATNKIIQATFKEIVENNLDLEAERILKEKFEEHFVFDNFFKDILQNSNNIEETKDEIMQDVVDTLLYNDGEISIEEIVIIIYSSKTEALEKKQKKKKKKGNGDIETQSLYVQVDDSIVELTNKMTTEEQKKAVANTEKQEDNSIIVKDVSRIEDYKLHKQKKNSFFKEFLRTVVPTVLITFLFITFVGQLAVVCGDSMNNNLSDGDIVFMEKISQKLGKLERFDVIIFDSGLAENPEFIKRIIGLPGEKVRIDNKGNIYINEKRLSENYGKETITYPGIAETTVTLGPDEYFVLGDNRNNSEDSRFSYIGAIELEKIKGKVCISLLPFYSIK